MTEAQLLKKLGLKIKQLRTDKGMSQSEFGLEIQMEKSNVSRMEAGNHNLKIGTLLRVANALEISLPELVDVR
ncbi:helix-turn-helix domain-containing protein [Niabella hirudinis]|uniref:helix-turn-helix domain-containing protein n=1 Tax=Niabella hirudinis TaxID=1285929 RepID=UPI003EC0E869